MAASIGEGPDSGNDPRQIGDGLVRHEAPRDPRSGDGLLDVCSAEQDQSGPTQVLSRFSEEGAGGFNSRVGIVAMTSCPALAERGDRRLKGKARGRPAGLPLALLQD